MSKLSGLGGRLYRGETSIDFIGKQRRWFAISGVVVIISAIALTTQGLKLGIEFKGGSAFTVTKTNISLQDARDAVAEVGVPGEPIIQKLGTNKVRVQTDALSVEKSNAIQDALAKKYDVSV